MFSVVWRRAQKLLSGEPQCWERTLPVRRTCGQMEVLCWGLKYGNGALDVNLLLICWIVSLFVRCLRNSWRLGSVKGQWQDCKTLVSFYKRKAPQRSLLGPLWWYRSHPSELYGQGDAFPGAVGTGRAGAGRHLVFLRATNEQQSQRFGFVRVAFGML